MYAEDRWSQSYPSGLHSNPTGMKDGTASRRQVPLRCANCDIDILWPPVVVQGKTYCCTGCAAGGPCNCDYSEYSSVSISGVIYYGTDVAQEGSQQNGAADRGNDCV
jgi:hypothetical protein